MTRAGRTPSGFEDGNEVLGEAVSKLQAQVLSPVDKERCKDCCRLVYFGDGERKDFASKLAWQKKGPLHFSVPSRICRGAHPPADWTWRGDHNSPLAQAPPPASHSPALRSTTASDDDRADNRRGTQPSTTFFSLAHPSLHPLLDLAAVFRKDRDHEFARRQQRPAVPRRHWR